MAIMTVLNDGDSDGSVTKSLKCVKLVKYIIGVISFVCFAIQAYTLTDQYLQKHTVVSTVLEKPTNLIMPAITVCVPVLIPFRRLCKPEETVDECANRLEMTANLTVNSTNSKSLWNLIRAQHENALITVYPLHDMIDDNLVDIIRECRLAKEYYTTDTHIQWENCVRKPVHTIIYMTKTSKSGQLCQTIFSQFQTDYEPNQYNIELKKFGNSMAFVVFEIQNEIWYQQNFKPNGIRVAIHPPNMIPSDIESKFMRIMPNKAYVIEYSRIVSHLLEPPYETNCRNYSRNPMSKSDCMQKCIFQHSWDHESNCRRQWNVLVIWEVNQNHEKLCAHNAKRDATLHRVRDLCEQQCLPDCYQQDYDVRIELSEDSNVTHDSLSSSSQIVLRKQTRADLFIYHNPELTFSSFVANVGGLAGIYLGLSVLALYDIIVYLCSYLFNLKYNCCKKYNVNKQ